MSETEQAHPVENSPEQSGKIESVSDQALAAARDARQPGSDQGGEGVPDDALNEPVAADTDSGGASASGDHGQQDVDDPGTLEVGEPSTQESS